MNTTKEIMTTEEIAKRFNELAKQERWFEIQDEFFSDDVKSIEPANSPYMPNATGKRPVRMKAEAFVKKITAVHRLYTGEPVVSGNHFAVARESDITVDGLGRVAINQIMVYEVRDGQIVLEQFFY